MSNTIADISKMTNNYQSMTSTLASLAKSATSQSKNLNSIKNSGQSRLNSVLNTTSIQIIAITSLTILANKISFKNKGIEGLVDKANDLVEIANLTQTTSDRGKAITAINTATSAIQDNQNKLQQLQQKLAMYRTVITISQVVATTLKISLDALFSSPTPSKPAAKTLSDKVDDLVKTVFSLSNIIGVILPSIINKLLNDLEEQRKRLESLINQAQSYSDDPKLSNASLITPSTGFLSDGSNTNNLFATTGLGVVPNVSYRGFSFVIKEENNPQFVVNGHKRHYAVAVNSNGRELLKTDPSFTLDPNVLIESLKTEIVRLGLIG